jgi:hypothetical protein
VAGAFVVAGGEGFVVLEPVESAFDDVAAPVGRPVEPALDRDSPLGEPVDCPVQDTSGGDGGLVVVHLGVCDAGVVVETVCR